MSRSANVKPTSQSKRTATKAASSKQSSTSKASSSTTKKKAAKSKKATSASASSTDKSTKQSSKTASNSIKTTTDSAAAIKPNALPDPTNVVDLVNSDDDMKIPAVPDSSLKDPPLKDPPVAVARTKRAKSQGGASSPATTKKKVKKAPAREKTESTILMITESNCESTIANKFADELAEVKKPAPSRKRKQTAQGSGETASKARRTAKSNNVGNEVIEDGANKLLEEFLNQQVQNVNVGNQLLQMENTFREANKKRMDEEMDWKKDMHIISKEHKKLMIKQLKMDMEIKAVETYQKMKTMGMDTAAIQRILPETMSMLTNIPPETDSSDSSSSQEVDNEDNEEEEHMQQEEIKTTKVEDEVQEDGQIPENSEDNGKTNEVSNSEDVNHAKKEEEAGDSAGEDDQSSSDSDQDDNDDDNLDADDEEYVQK